MDSALKVQLIAQIAIASDDKLTQIATILGLGVPESVNPGDSKLYKLCEAAKTLNVSRMTLWRMMSERKIDFVNTGSKGRRISGLALRKYVSGGNNG